MWSDITYSCGHEERIQLYGSASERETRIKYLSDYKLCPECLKKERLRKAEELGILRIPESCYESGNESGNVWSAGTACYAASAGSKLP